MQEGDYTFQLTVTDSSGQQDTAQVTVIVQPGKHVENKKCVSMKHQKYLVNLLLRALIAVFVSYFLTTRALAKFYYV